MSYKLVVCIVPHGFGEQITGSAKNAGANGGTIIMGRGTASNGILQVLGLGDTSKDITYIVTKEEQCEQICQAIKDCVPEKQKHFGVMFCQDTGDFWKAGSQIAMNNENKGAAKMNKNEYEVINIIVNKGYADDAMAAARKAGAGGGTIISARGTAKEGDAKFFGMEIVPEKDMLMILVPSEKKDEIVTAISSLACFQKAGSGIIFCNQAQNFTVLGK